MDVQTAEVPDIVESLVDGQTGEVLVAKCDDLLLRNEEGELIFASVS